MPGEVLTVVRTPIMELAEEIRNQHRILGPLVDTRIEGDVLVMYFSRTSLSGDSAKVGNAVSRGSVSSSIRVVSKSRRRAAKGKRNRMKTRGWDVVDKFVNSRGQKTLIYRPFLDALKGKKLSPTQQKTVVAQILRANGNSPGSDSIDYFLMNTLEYLKKTASTEGG